MSQKKIKQEKRELKSMQKGQGGMGKWITGAVIVAVAGMGVYLMVGGQGAPAANDAKTGISTNTSTTTMDNAQNQGLQTLRPAAKSHEIAVIETAKGTMKVQLYPEDAPKTVANFVSLVNRKFYDGLTFHRVEPGFVIQGGDPKGDGTGGSGTSIPLEIKCADGTMTEGRTATCEPLLKHLDGAIAMARTSDPNSATSQFYITLGAQSFLDKNYAVFGYVVEGLDVASKIVKGDAIKRVYMEKQ